MFMRDRSCCVCAHVMACSSIDRHWCECHTSSVCFLGRNERGKQPCKDERLVVQDDCEREHCTVELVMTVSVVCKRKRRLARHLGGRAAVHIRP